MNDRLVAYLKGWSVRVSLAMLVVVMVISLAPVIAKASAGVIPTISIVSVTPDVSVKIRTQNFPPDRKFTARMGEFGTKAIGGIVVGTFNSGPGGTFDVTFSIPNELKGKKLIAIRTDSETGGYYSYNWFTNKEDGTPPSVTPGGTTYSGIPTFSVSSVVTDVSVTILTHNFPPGKTFTVRMGKMGTKGIGGVVAGTFTSGTGGSFSQTIPIPAELKGYRQIAIRTDADSGGYYSYNWFWNDTSTTSSTPIPYSGIPTFSIDSVVTDTSVTILTKNFPPGKVFTVRMNKIGTKGIGGVVVGTFDSGAGGAFKQTFNIPAELMGLPKIAIRTDADSGGYYSYNWFWNNTSSGTGGTVTSGYTGYPTFSILSVKRDQTVTIKTNNLTPGQTFTVRMGAYGTKAIGGAVVATTDSGTGGVQTLTYTIPDSLKGSKKIAIRMDSPLGYYAFNWFYNNDSD